MSSLVQLVNLWDNPVFHRFRRSQLRTKKSIFWYLATLIITTFSVASTYLSQVNFMDFTAEEAARSQWLTLLVIQGLILLFKGTGQTASGVIQDKIDETLDYQRLTPVTPLRNVVGYLFGLPVLEYVMFALTLPHLAFVVIVGNIPIGTVFSVYLVFLTCTIFYHMTAVTVGLVIKRWIWGYLLSIFSVAFLNMVLPGIASQFGLKFLQFLSIVPVVGQKVMPLMAQFGPRPGQFGPPQGQVAQPVNEASFLSFDDPVPFFDWTLSPFYFTLLLQSMLIVTLATMAVRRWKKETKHSFSKPYALGILGVFILLLIGNLWPVITGQFLPFAIFGSTNIDELSEILAIALPMVYSITVWLLCMFLYFNVVPTHHDYVRGIRRAKKLNRKAPLPWDDDSANIPFMSLFVILSLIGFWVLYGQMMDAGFMSFLAGADFPHWRLPLGLGLVLLYSLLLLQVLQYRGVILTVLLVWLLPILVGIVSAAAIEDVTRFQSVLASLSPLATLIMTGMLPMESIAIANANVNANVDEGFAILQTGVRSGFLFLIAQIGLLAYRWRRLRQVLH